jgi:hypothetical protein
MISVILRTRVAIGHIYVRGGCIIVAEAVIELALKTDLV